MEEGCTTCSHLQAASLGRPDRRRQSQPSPPPRPAGHRRNDPAPKRRRPETARLQPKARGDGHTVKRPSSWRETLAGQRRNNQETAEELKPPACRHATKMGLRTRIPFDSGDGDPSAGTAGYPEAAHPSEEWSGWLKGAWDRVQDTARPLSWNAWMPWNEHMAGNQSVAPEAELTVRLGVNDRSRFQRLRVWG